LASASEFALENAADYFKSLYIAVYLDVSIGDESAGRLEIELSARLCPITSANFLSLCTGPSDQEIADVDTATAAAEANGRKKGKSGAKSKQGCRGGLSGELAKPLCYKGSAFYRIVPGQFCHVSFVFVVFASQPAHARLLACCCV
jgi:hypothetical protein